MRYVVILWHRTCVATLCAEVNTMAFDMTAQLVPMFWGLVAVMAVSSLSVLLSHE